MLSGDYAGTAKRIAAAQLRNQQARASGHLNVLLGHG